MPAHETLPVDRPLGRGVEGDRDTDSATERAIRTDLERIAIALEVLAEELGAWGELRAQLKRLASDTSTSADGEDAGSQC